jgi:hypothetical protein
MNAETFASVMIRLFGAYQFFAAIDDMAYCVAKLVGDPHFQQYLFYFIMIGARFFFGAFIVLLAVPLAKLLTLFIPK